MSNPQTHKNETRGGVLSVLRPHLVQTSLVWRDSFLVFTSDLDIILTSWWEKIKPEANYCLFFVLFRFRGTDMCCTIPNWSEPDTNIVRTKYTKNPGSDPRHWWYFCSFYQIFFPLNGDLSFLEEMQWKFFIAGLQLDIPIWKLTHGNNVYHKKYQKF